MQPYKGRFFYSCLLDNRKRIKTVAISHFCRNLLSAYLQWLTPVLLHPPISFYTYLYGNKDPYDFIKQLVNCLNKRQLTTELLHGVFHGVIIYPFYSWWDLSFLSSWPLLSFWCLWCLSPLSLSSWPPCLFGKTATQELRTNGKIINIRKSLNFLFIIYNIDLLFIFETQYVVPQIPCPKLWIFRFDCHRNFQEYFVVCFVSFNLDNVIYLFLTSTNVNSG